MEIDWGPLQIVNELVKYSNVNRKFCMRSWSFSLLSKIQVQIRPWNLNDSDFVMDGSHPLDPRKTIFVGGVPRPLRAIELAMIMDRLYGGVCYAGIDVDPELKYPKGDKKNCRNTISTWTYLENAVNERSESVYKGKEIKIVM